MRSTGEGQQRVINRAQAKRARWERARRRPEQPGKGRSGSSKKIAAAVGGVIVAAAGSALGAWLTNAPAQVGQAVADSGAPLVASAQIVQEPDQGNSMAAPDGYTPSSQTLREMSKPDEPPSMQFFNGVAADGGVGLQDLSIRLVVAGSNSQGINIMNVRLVSLRRQPPLGGTLFSVPPQAANPTLSMMFNLDEASPIARRIAQWSGDDPRPAEPYFAGHTVSLAKGERQVFFIRTTTARFYATFDLEIDYTVGNDIGDMKKMIVGDGSKLFGVTGLHPGPRRGTVSYQHAYAVDNSHPYALCEVKDSSVIPLEGQYPDTGACVSSK